MTHAAIRRLSVAASLGMFLVLLMGAAVTSTGSSQGCGQSWPLCNGRFVPELAFTAMVEYSHRAVTGVVGLLVAALSVSSWLIWRRHREIRVLAALMMGFLFLQSGLGAWAVLYPQTPAVLALHFGISLVSFASVVLTMSFVHRVDSTEARGEADVPTWFRRGAWAAICYVYLVVYLGAYIRHTHASLACLDWPLCNGSLFPGFAGSVGVVFLHRVAAVGAVLLLGWLALAARGLRHSRPDLARWSHISFGLVVVQVASGAAVVFGQLALATTLVHGGVMALLFASLGLVVYRSLPHRPGALAPVDARLASPREKAVAGR
jgi:cytochrome c oxidase assembly protein subunit 15